MERDPPGQGRYHLMIFSSTFPLSNSRKSLITCCNKKWNKLGKSEDFLCFTCQNEIQSGIAMNPRVGDGSRPPDSDGKILLE